MTGVDLNLLAQRVAEQLARRDSLDRGGAVADSANRERASGAASPGARPSAESRVPSPAPAGAPAPPAGVRFVRDQARIADFIDHTLLKAEATRADVEKLCAEARDNRFAAVCVNPAWVPLCHERLAGSGVVVATVIGFPLGANQPAVKGAEARLAVEQGADEVDMVAAVGHIKSGDWAHVAEDIAAVVKGASGRLVKVIIESATLTPLETVKASAIAREEGAHYVKTSTGFHAAGGASAEAVALMRLAVGDALGVKASGGVRDCETALRMIAAGATRIGTSSGVGMVKCLGPGPLPIAELLASPHRHGASCALGGCSNPGSASSAAGQPY